MASREVGEAPAKEHGKPRPDARPLLRCLLLRMHVWRVRDSRDKGEALEIKAHLGLARGQIGSKSK